MKKFATLAITALAVCALATSAFADAGDLGVSFDQAGTTTNAAPPVFTTTNLFYVVAEDANGGTGIAGFEFDLIVDPNILTFGVPVILPAGSPINVGDGPNELIVGLGNCAQSAGVTPLVQWTYGVFAPGLSDLLICIVAASPSSFAPAVPGYLGCDSSLNSAGARNNGGGSYPDGCGVVYASDPGNPIATSHDSFGAVKGRF